MVKQQGKITAPQMRALRAVAANRPANVRTITALQYLGLLDVAEPTDRARTLLDQVSGCTNCGGTGEVTDWRPRSLGRGSVPVQWACRCRTLPAIVEDEPVVIAEIPAWMLGTDEEN